MFRLEIRLKNIAVVIGHPFTGSFSHALAERYIEDARRCGATLRILDLATHKFSTIPTALNEVRVRGIDGLDALEPSIAGMVRDMEWADHIVFVYPVWWGTYPAVLKGFIDRVVLSGVAFKYGSKPTKWQKLWRGKTARIIYTMDTPIWWNRLVYKAPSENSLRWSTLWYVGVKTIGVTKFTPIRTSTAEGREKWLRAVGQLGAKDA